ncbi:MAG: hypothetical protein ABI808_06305 [Pseudonocardiales bacterium]
MEDLTVLLESHTCIAGQCSQRSHSHVQPVLVSASDVATAVDEIRLLVSVRDQLAQAGFRMLEMEPTPRFEGDSDGEPKSWALLYEAIPVPGIAGPPPSLFGFFRRRA